MLQTPLRLLLTLRPSTTPGLLVAIAVSTAVFSATPFLVTAIAADRDIAVGAVGVISTAQLGGFMIASWGAGRLLRPRRRTLAVAVLLGIAANAWSAVAPTFALLVASRLVSGISLGLISWIAWAEVFGDDDKVGDIAVIGPIVGIVSSPLIATVLDAAGPDVLFLALSALHLVPLAFIGSTRIDAAARPHRQRHRPTRAAAAILAALGCVTFGGSAVFVYAAAIGRDEIGLPALTVSLAFSANALAGVPSARWRGVRRLSGAWIVVTASMAVLLTTVQNPVVFWLALTMWGFSFWMAIPGAFSLLAERSRYPDERAGDAQAVMAAGRVAGPLLGGAVYATSIPMLGVVGGGIILVAATAMLYVEWRIHPDVLRPSRA